MAKCKESMDFAGVDDAFGRLLAAQLSFGRELLKVAGGGIAAAVGALGGVRLPRMKSCCDIPEPCWMPLSLGELCCSLCAGDTGEVCLIVSNEDFRGHSYRVAAAGKDADKITVSDPQFDLGPKERRLVTVRFKVPEGEREQREETCCECNDYEAVVWVLGCRNHYLRWQVDVSDRHTECCYQAEVRDQPDYELHWYDHFHVYRPCYGPQTLPEKDKG